MQEVKYAFEPSIAASSLLSVEQGRDGGNRAGRFIESGSSLFVDLGSEVSETPPRIFPPDKMEGRLLRRRGTRMGESHIEGFGSRGMRRDHVHAIVLNLYLSRYKIGAVHTIFSICCRNLGGF